MSKPREWPSREEWAKRETTFFCYPEYIDSKVTRAARAYGTPAEVIAVIHRLRKRWNELGESMANIKASIGSLLRQPGETKIQHNRRFVAMSIEEQERTFPYGIAQHRRQHLKKAITALEKGELPNSYDTSIVEDDSLFEPLLGSYRMARERELDRQRREKGSTPIDDAAWERELQRRKEFEEQGGRIFTPR